MNINELHDMLAERAEDAARASAPSDLWLAGVLGRARAIRRRRYAIAGVVAACVIALSAAVAPDIFRAVDPPPANRSDESLTTYAHGGRLIERTTINLPTRQASVTVTPEALPLTFVTQCDRPLHVRIRFPESSGGGIISGHPCGGEYDGVGVVDQPTPGDEPRIELGKPVTFTVTVTGSSDEPESATMPTDGRVVVGVYEQVPREEYIFPPRPDTLVELDTWASPGPHTQVVRSRDDPNAPVVLDLEGDDFDLEIKSQTPGIMRVLVNGKEIDVARFWDYTGKTYTLSSLGQAYGEDYPYTEDNSWRLPDGGVRLKLVPQHFSGAWEAALLECEVEGDEGWCPPGP